MVDLDQKHGHHRRHGPHLGLGEVDDPVGPVDEDQAEGHQGVEQTDDGAERHRPERRRVVAQEQPQEADEHDAPDDGAHNRADRRPVQHRSRSLHWRRVRPAVPELCC